MYGPTEVKPSSLMYFLYRDIDKLIEELTGEELKLVAKTIHEALALRLRITDGPIKDEETMSDKFMEYGKEMHKSGIFNLLGIDYVQHTKPSDPQRLYILEIKMVKKEKDAEEEQS